METALDLSATAPQRCLVAMLSEPHSADSSLAEADEDGQQAAADRERVLELRRTLQARVPTQNVMPIKYAYPNACSPATNRCLQQFSSDFIEKVKELVQKSSLDNNEEVSTSRQHCAELLANLESRPGPLVTSAADKVIDWVKGHARSTHPLVISGAAGYGKTSLLAMLCRGLGSQPAPVVRRFRQEDALLHRRQLLDELAEEVHQRLREADEDGEALAADAENGLGQAGGRLLVLLDDVDVVLAPSALDPECGPLDADWLSGLTQSRVLLVATATIVAHLGGEWHAAGDANVLQLPPWTRGEIVLVLDGALEKHARALTPEQREAVLDRCFRNPSALFVTRAVDFALHTCSFDPATSIPEDLEQFYRVTFDTLERRLGADLVTSVCRYVSLSYLGLTETELCDFLTSAEFGQRAASPQAGQWPASSWIILKNQLSALWTRQWRHHRLVLSWRQQTAAAYVSARYLSNRADRLAVHSDLSNLHLLGFLVTSEDAVDDGKLDDASCQSVLSRQKALQSLRLADGLWYHLVSAGDLECLKLTILCNFRYMWQAARHLSPRHLCKMVAATRHWFLDWEAELVHHVLNKTEEIGGDWSEYLATQLLIWLHHVSGRPFSPISHLLASVVDWCTRQKSPLLVPGTVWLRHSLPDQVWDLALPEPVHLYVPAADGVHVYVACGGREFHLWHLLTSRSVHTFRGHTGDVTCVYPSPDGRHVVSGSEDCHVIVWSGTSFRSLFTIDRHIAPVLCVWSSCLASRGDVVVSGGEDSCLYVTRLRTPEDADDVSTEPHQLSQHRGPVTCIEVNTDSEVMASGSHDRTVILWSLETLTVLNEISMPSAVSHMSVSGGAMFLLTACLDMTVYVHSFTTGSPLHSLRNHQSQVTAVTSSEDGNLCVVGCRDSKVYVYDIPSARLLRTLSRHGSPVLAARLTSNGHLLITAGASRVVVTHVQPLTVKPRVYVSDRKKIPVEHQANITCLDISADETMVVTGSMDSHLKVWLAPSGDLHATLEGHTGPVTCVQFAPNGLYAVSGSEDTSIRVWGLTLNLVVAAFTDHEMPVVSVCVLSDSKRTLSADKSGVLMLWQVETGVVLLTCRGPGDMIRVTPDRNYAVSGKSGGNQLYVWTLSKDDTKNVIGHNDVIRCFDVSSDSLHVITGSNDASLKVWTIAEGRLTQVLVGHEAAVTCAAYPAFVSHTAASGSDDCLVMAWDVDTGQTRQVIRDHKAPVTAVCMTADAGLIVSGSSDGRIFVHSVTSGQRVTSLTLHAVVAGLRISDDAGQIVARLQNSMYFALLSLLNGPPLAACARPKTVVQPITEGRRPPEASMSPASGRRPPPHRRALKKGISLDTYTWQRKYGGLLSKMAPLSPVNGEKPRRKISEDEARMCPIGGTIHTSQHAAPRRTDSREQLVGPENGSARITQPPPAAAPQKRQLNRTNTALVLTVNRRPEEPAGGGAAPSGMPESLLRLRRAAAGCGPAGGGLTELVDLLHRSGHRSKFCSIL